MNENEHNLASLNKIFQYYGPLVCKKSNNLFFEIAQIFESEIAILFEMSKEGRYKPKDTFYHIPKSFSNNIYLNKESSLSLELKDKKEKILIVNQHEISKYDEFTPLGIKAFIAAAFTADVATQSILFIATKKEISKTKQVPFPLKYHRNSIQLIKLTISFLASHTPFKRALESGNDKEYKDFVIPSFINYLRQSISISKEKNIPSPTLKLSNHFLLSYFLFRVIEDLINNKNGELLNSYSPEEMCNFYKSLGKAIKFYFYKQQENSEEELLKYESNDYTEYIEAICHLIGEYTSKYLKIERCFDIEKHLKLFFSSQTLLYFLKINYRDHLFHMIDICFLGFFLLDSKVNNNRKLKDLILEKTSFNHAKLLRNWFVAALFHDIGYILSLYDYVQKEVGFINSPEIDKVKTSLATIQCSETTTLNRTFSQKLEEYNVDIKEISNLSTLDHGVISASHTMNIITKEYSDEEQLTSKIEEYLPAISAIAHHNLSYTELSIEKQPIGVLLTLFDELQEWERQVIETLSLKDKLAASIRFNNPFLSDSLSIIEEIHIQVEENFNPFTDEGHISRNGNLCFVLDYSKAKDQKEFKPMYTWLMKSHKLQHLSLNEHFNVEITFINAIRDYGPEYSYLKNNRRRSQMWSFEKWITLVEELYYAEEDKEYLSINVKKLNKNKPLKYPPLEDLKALEQSLGDMGFYNINKECNY